MSLVRVGDVADQIRGVTYGKGDVLSSDDARGIPVIRANNITEEGLVFDDLVYVDARQVSDRQRLCIGDVVVAASSGSISVVGKAAQVQAQYDGAFGAFCKVVRPGPRVNARYLGHYFRTPTYRRRISALAAGANINNLKSADIDDLEIPLPPWAEQQRIASILDQADALRRKRSAELARLETLPSALFQQHFGDWSRPDNGATLVKIGAKLDFLTSGSRGWASYYRDAGALFLRIQNVRHDELDLGDVAYVEAPDTAEAKRTRVLAGDVLLSITADLGRTAVVPPGIGEAFINQHLAILRSSYFHPRYLSAALASPAGQKAIQARNREGVKAGLNFDDIRSLEVPDADRNMQNEFTKMLGAIDATKARLKVGVRELDALFASLQHRAFRGEF